VSWNKAQPCCGHQANDECSVNRVPEIREVEVTATHAQRSCRFAVQHSGYFKNWILTFVEIDAYPVSTTYHFDMKPIGRCPGYNRTSLSGDVDHQVHQRTVSSRDDRLLQHTAAIVRTLCPSTKDDSKFLTVGTPPKADAGLAARSRCDVDFDRCIPSIDIWQVDEGLMASAHLQSRLSKVFSDRHSIGIVDRPLLSFELDSLVARGLIVAHNHGKKGG
jgi:hypothetical protein